MTTNSATESAAEDSSPGTAVSAAHSHRPPTVSSRVAELAAMRIAPWQKGYLGDSSKDVAALARLRRGAGRAAGDVPDLWSLIDIDPLHDATGMPRPLSERELTFAENALHVALTLWALHQQSRGTRMHQASNRKQPTGLGASVRRLMRDDEIDAPLRKRLVRAGTSPDLASLSQRLRDLVVLLRRAEIPLDYGLLAGELYAWQWPGGAATVRQAWSRSFHSWHPQPSDSGTSTPTDPDKDSS